jgi:hypothetical protein
MSFHHPLALHGSDPNASAEPRIGLSATYSTPGLHRNGTAVALVRGSVGPQPWFPLSSKPADLPLEEAVAAYRASSRQLLYAPSSRRVSMQWMAWRDESPVQTDSPRNAT